MLPARRFLSLAFSSCTAFAVCAQPQPPDSFQASRTRMIEEQLKAREIRDPGVLAAMARVPRHLFVPENLRRSAYEDGPLPIGHGQTISQPYIVAYMTEALALEPTHVVLEIGTGSGYQAAVLAEIAKQVCTIEIVPELAERARQTLAQAGYRNIDVRTGDGYRGWPERAPFPRIIVTAAPPEIPSGLVDQLAVRHHGRASGHVLSGDRDHHENGRRHHPETDDSSQVCADGGRSVDNRSARMRVYGRNEGPTARTHRRARPHEYDLQRTPVARLASRRPAEERQVHARHAS